MACIHIETANALFLHIPKTAGWSVTQALEAAYPEARIYKTRGLGRRRGAASDLSRKIRPDVLTTTYSFCFVRNPWDWTVSGWKHVTERRNAYGDAPPAFGDFVRGAWRAGIVRNPHRLKFGSAELFVAYHTQVTQWQHLSLGRRQAPMAFYGRFEHLAEDWTRLCERLRRTIRLPHANESRRAGYEDYYDDETRRIVAERNAPLIERFGYRFGG